MNPPSSSGEYCSGLWLITAKDRYVNEISSGLSDESKQKSQVGRKENKGGVKKRMSGPVNASLYFINTPQVAYLSFSLVVFISWTFALPGEKKAKVNQSLNFSQRDSCVHTLCPREAKS